MNQSPPQPREYFESFLFWAVRFGAIVSTPGGSSLLGGMAVMGGASAMDKTVCSARPSVIARTIDVHSLGEFAVVVTLKGDSGAGRPLEDADFNLTCTAPVALSARLRTDAVGHATTLARPGECLRASRAPVRIDAKSYSWRGDVELIRDKERSFARR